MATLPPLKWRRSPNFSDRTVGPVDLVVVHRPVGSYLGSINTLMEDRGEESASAHGILGRPKPGAGLEFTQLVAWSKKAWACMAFNSRSDNLEIADAAWDGTDPEAWKVAARIVAYRLKRRGLKPRWARGGRGSGFCRHYDLGAAGGGHTDPTTSTTQWLRFVAQVKWEFARGGFRDDWGYDAPPLFTNLVVYPESTTTGTASNVTVTFKAVPPAVVKKPKPSPVKPKAAAKPQNGPTKSAQTPALKKAAPKKATPKPAAPKKSTKPAPKKK